MAKKKRAYRGRAMERFKQRKLGRVATMPQCFVTDIGGQAIMSMQMQEASPWTLYTYALIRECQEATESGALGKVAPGAAFVLIASDLLEMRWGPEASWERLDIDEAAGFAQRQLQVPGIATDCSESLVTFMDFLRATGRLHEAPMNEDRFRLCAPPPP